MNILSTKHSNVPGPPSFHQINNLGQSLHLNKLQQSIFFRLGDNSGLKNSFLLNIEMVSLSTGLLSAWFGLVVTSP